MLIADQNLVKKINKRRILEEVIQHSPISRASLSKVTGLNKSTVSAQVQELVDEQFLFEIGQGKSSGGRRPVMLMFNKQAGYAIGVDLGVEDLTVLLTDLGGAIVAEEYVWMGEQPAHESLKQLIQTIRNVIGQIPSSPYGLLGIGIGVPGLVSRNGHILLTPNAQWGDIDLKKVLSDEFGVSVMVENEANTGAYGEKLYGAAQQYEDVVFVSVGTGIGVGLLLDGKLFKGVRGVSGEMGHMTIDFNGPKCNCGNRGCWELYASDKALRKSLPEKLEEAEISRRLQQNDPDLFSAVEQFGDAVGIGLVNIVNTFDPEAIILRHSLTEENPIILNIIRNTLQSRMNIRLEAECLFLPSSLGKKASPLGAASMIIEKFIYQITA